jgi:hypothetical protein
MDENKSNEGAQEDLAATSLHDSSVESEVLPGDPLATNQELSSQIEGQDAEVVVEAAPQELVDIPDYAAEDTSADQITGDQADAAGDLGSLQNDKVSMPNLGTTKKQSSLGSKGDGKKEKGKEKVIEDDPNKPIPKEFSWSKNEKIYYTRLGERPSVAVSFWARRVLLPKLFNMHQALAVLAKDKETFKEVSEHVAQTRLVVGDAMVAMFRESENRNEAQNKE